MKNYKYIYLAIILFVVLLSSCSTSNVRKDDINNILTEDYQIDTSQIKNIARDYVINGSKLQMQERHAEAILEFFSAQKYDSSAAIDFAIAKSYRALYKLEETKEYLDKSLKKSPDFIPSLEMLTEIYLIRNEISKAIATIEYTNKIQKNRIRMITLARLYEYQNLDKAIAIYEDLLEESEDAPMLLRLSYLYKENKQNEDYYKTIGKLISSNIEFSPDEALEIIEMLIEKKDYDKAATVIDSLDVKKPLNELQYIYWNTFSYIDSDTSKKVEEFASRLLDKVDNRFYFDWRINYFGGAWALRMKLNDRADKYFNKALAVGDTISDLSLQIAGLYTRYQFIEKADSIYTKYSLVFPQDIRFILFNAGNYFNSKNYKRALELSNKAFEHDSTHIDVCMLLASIHEKMNNTDLAFKLYQYTLNLDKNNPLVNNNYAYLLAEKDLELDKALNMSKLALSIEPENPSYLDTYAWVLYKMANYEEALIFIKKALNYFEGSTEVFDHLGDIYIKLNEKNKAIDAWNKALKLEPFNETIMKKIKENK